jgi:uncharacterized protein
MQESDTGRTPVSGRSRLNRVIQFPLVRLFIALVAVYAALGLAAFVPGPSTQDVLGGEVGFGVLPLLSLAAPLATILAYVAYVRVVERRPVTELAVSRAPVELGAGVLLGACYMSATVGIIWLLGGYEFVWTHAWSVLFAQLLSIGISAGVIEEILFRGILFRITEEALGTWLALALSAAVFGAVHIFNVNATVVGAVAIAIEAGILLSALYVLTRRLWVSIGLHAAWNVTQGGIFGVPVSGNEASAGLLSAEPVGPVLLSGGEFGAEGSIVAMVLGLILGVYFLVRSVQRGRIVRPFWQRRDISRKREALSQQGA